MSIAFFVIKCIYWREQQRKFISRSPAFPSSMLLNKQILICGSTNRRHSHKISIAIVFLLFCFALLLVLSRWHCLSERLVESKIIFDCRIGRFGRTIEHLTLADRNVTELLHSRGNHLPLYHSYRLMINNQSLFLCRYREILCDIFSAKRLSP